ncbi:hypothetical protein ABIB66_008939, partial [Bradyrhizobium sp. F1.13.3]
MGSYFPHAVSFEDEAVSVVDEAMVGSAMTSCQFSIGTWLVMMVDPRWCRSST